MAFTETVIRQRVKTDELKQHELTCARISAVKRVINRFGPLREACITEMIPGLPNTFSLTKITRYGAEFMQDVALGCILPLVGGGELRIGRINKDPDLVFELTQYKAGKGEGVEPQEVRYPFVVVGHTDVRMLKWVVDDQCFELFYPDDTQLSGPITVDNRDWAAIYALGLLKPSDFDLSRIDNSPDSLQVKVLRILGIDPDKLPSEPEPKPYKRPSRLARALRHLQYHLTA